MAVTKKYIETALRHFKDCGVEPDSERNIVVSLTSYPARMPEVHYALFSLLKQSLKPNKIILWLGEEQFPNREHDIPEKTLALQKNGLEIRWTKDIKSYKKLVPALREYPDAVIVTADDDLLYDPHWLRLLYTCYQRNSFAPMVYAHRAHRIQVSPKGDVAQYFAWLAAPRACAEDAPSWFNFATTGAGALYPPHVLHSDIFNEELLLQLAPSADDIFFWAAAVMHGTKTKVVENNILSLMQMIGGAGLYEHNVLQGKNDEQLVNIFTHYPDIAIKLGTELKVVQRARAKQNAEQATVHSSAYWEYRYSIDGDSGAGSYNRLAEFKAKILNGFTEEHDIERVVEFGSGDGNQLSLCHFKNYIGFDVSPTVIKLTREKFAKDSSKTFLHVDEYAGQTAELALSLDVIYHLIEDDVFDAYMHRLFASAEKYVIIYSSNKIGEQCVEHVKHRKFTDWVEKNAKNFALLQFIPNQYPIKDKEDAPDTSFADFYVFGNTMALTLELSLPKISILVPVFNTEKYLRQCLDSILGQTYQHIEVICVNDGSTDNSLAILHEYARKDRRIIVIDKSINEGLPQARKTAFTRSTGQYILHVDSDDWIDLNMLEVMYHCSVFGGYDMVCCGLFHEKSSGTHVGALQVYSEDKTERIKYGVFGYGRAKAVWNKLVKREIHKKVNFGQENNGEDCYITCQNLYYSDKVGCYPLPLYHYRYSDTSLTTDESIVQERYEDLKTSYNRIIEFCKEKFGNDLSFFEPELSLRMAVIETQKPKSCL